jgi:hypothetical protein
VGGTNRNELIWRADLGQLEANVSGVPWTSVLTNLAAVTGWTIYVEPGVRREVNARFRGVPLTDGLRRLFGELNFAILSRPHASPALYLYSTDMGKATERIDQPVLSATDASGGKKPIKNELVVSLRPGAKDVAGLAKRLGAASYQRLEGTDSYLFRFADEAAAANARSQLGDSGEAESVDFNYSIAPPLAPELLASGPMPPSPVKARPVGEGGKVIVGLIDTSVHSAGINFKDFLLPALSLADAPALTPGELTHGTAMAETIIRGLAQVASDTGSTVRILPVDVYGSSAETTTFDVARGIQAALQSGANVINLSLGSDADTPYLQRLIKDARAQGIVFIGAAGNSPVTTPYYPAAYPEVIAVTAGDRNGRIASYANRGEFVDLVAPGTSLVHFNNQTFMGSGTSYSSALVSGVAAGLGEGGRTASQIEQELMQRLAAPPTPSP